MTSPHEHLPCPECGYDLYGMAEGRCPECGFGFDREAVQRIHEHRAERRIIAGAGIIRSAAAALALNVSMLSWVVGMGPLGRVILVPAAIIVGAWVWVRLLDYHPAVSFGRWVWTSIVWLALMHLAAALLWLPALGTGLSLFPVARAWFIRVADWDDPGESVGLVTADVRSLIRRFTYGATAMLLLATIATVVCLLSL